MLFLYDWIIFHFEFKRIIFSCLVVLHSLWKQRRATSPRQRVGIDNYILAWSLFVTTVPPLTGMGGDSGANIRDSDFFSPPRSAR